MPSDDQLRAVGGRAPEARTYRPGGRRDIYRHIESNLHWLVFQFLGKLLPIVYVLRKT